MNVQGSGCMFRPAPVTICWFQMGMLFSDFVPAPCMEDNISVDNNNKMLTTTDGNGVNHVENRKNLLFFDVSL